MSEVSVNVGRYRALDAPRMRPGHCHFCHGTEHPPFVDTGLDVDFVGAVYVCAVCIDSMALSVNNWRAERGLLPEPEKVPEITETEAYIQGVQAGKASIYAALGVALADVPTPVFPGSPPVSPVEGDAGKQESDEFPVGDDQGDSGVAGGSKPGTDEGNLQGDGSPSVAGRSGVSSDSNDGSELFRI